MDKMHLSQKDKLFKADLQDPYRAAMHNKGPAYCGDCGASYQAGRWSWQKLAEADAAARISCPACRRKADNAPAGTLTLSGPFVLSHHQDIVNVINHVEQAEKSQHPLERLMRISPSSDGLQVTTTGVHLANRIGHALESAFGGKASYHHDDQRRHVAVRWSR
ncbi:ATPase [Permianibacter sp. IMCC34836]|uniref:BCAM0308 family protein n=1 Tax=Permianibacter fluminis TaxID=2738515 RepID=UPI0015557EE0|nr:BCAM0308 family protein [Permianibacter fluminis]NQD37990.1 ATPase [Permianibacter fluminis]